MLVLRRRLATATQLPLAGELKVKISIIDLFTKIYILFDIHDRLCYTFRIFYYNYISINRLYHYKPYPNSYIRTVIIININV
jgi:hypothetical protein